MNRSHRTITRSLAAVAATAILSGLTAATLSAPASAADREPTATTLAGREGTDAPAGRQVSAAEQRAVQALDFAKIARTARPAERPQGRHHAEPRAARQGAPVSVQGHLAAGGAQTRVAASRTAAVTGAIWPGAYNANPNKQIGKLYFDVNPSPTVTEWQHCTGTVVNSANKSLIVTAGHCVYDFTNRRWYTQLWFYPGYQNGTHLGAWTVRHMYTTNNYFYNGRYADDMAVVLVNRDSANVPIVTRVGAHGINFNQAVNQVRTSLGYPVTDYRWPGWTSSGNDLYYCQGTDTYYSTGTFAGQMFLGCYMTGGASGGPWLTNVASNWMGTVNSVNSNKGYGDSRGSGYMFGPYFDNQELGVYNTGKNA